MKKGRRLLAILMAICLVCAYMPVSAFGVEGMKLKFSAAELAHGSVSYKIGDADYVDVDEATKDASGAIWIDLSSDSKGKMIYIKVTPEDSFAVNNIVAKEGDADSANPAYGGNFDKETGVYSFVLDSVIYPVEIGISKVDESSGDNPGGGESGNNPEGETNHLYTTVMPVISHLMFVALTEAFPISAQIAKKIYLRRDGSQFQLKMTGMFQ